MALYKITLKRSANINSVRLGKGMSVEIVSTSTYPLNNSKDRDGIIAAFTSKYGIDMKKANILNFTNMFEVVKIN